MTEIFVPLGLFGMVVAIVYLVNRKRERLALIEKGADASIFRENKTDNPSLKWGILLVMLGIAMILANILVYTGSMEEESAYLSMLFLFGGSGLLIYYFLARKDSRSAGEDKDQDTDMQRKY
jgi:hypothetical protein